MFLERAELLVRQLVGPGVASLGVGHGSMEGV